VRGLIRQGAIPVVRIAGRARLDKRDVKRLISRAKGSARRPAMARTGGLDTKTF